MLPKLIFINDSGKQFNITITIDSEPDKKFIITNQDLPKMENLSFVVKSETDNSDKEFNLLYQIFKDGKGENRNYYCANQRTVKEFDKKEIDITLPEKGSSLMLLSSDYLDETVNDERTDFYIKAKETTLAEPFSWKDINSNLRKELDVVVNNRYPNLLKEKESAANSLAQDYPHLSKYIKPLDNICVGELNETKIIREAVKQYEADKESIREDFKKLINNNVDADSDKVYQEYIDISDRISELNCQELAEYVLYRQKIIDILLRLIKEKRSTESFLHNLLMKMRTTSLGNYRDTNLWLLDDKFMSFAYAASDKEFNTISNDIWGKQVEVEEGDKRKRPDLYISFSEGETAPHRDCVIVEIKGVHASRGEKRKAITEIWDNMGAVKDNFPNIQNVYGYIIMDFDEVLDKTFFRGGQFKPVFARGNYKVYFGFNDVLNMSCFIISVTSLAYDANARNKTFLNILRKENKD